MPAALPSRRRAVMYPQGTPRHTETQTDGEGRVWGSCCTPREVLPLPGSTLLITPCWCCLGTGLAFWAWQMLGRVSLA